MTIASEITRLQGAKSSIETSIENKGVTVPSSATLDTYSTYIDQINTGTVMMDSLALKEYYVDGLDSTPRVGGFISWENSSTYYGASIVTTEAGSSSNQYYYLVGMKKQSGSDMQYIQAKSSSYASSIHGKPKGVVFYWKSDAIRVFFYESTTYSSNSYFRFQADWNLSSDSMSVSYLERNDSTSLPSSADTSGYSIYTYSYRIKSITPQEIDDDSYIYLTLK